MNILQIANKAIYPPDGGSLAILSLSKGYICKGHNVHLLNMLTHKHSNKPSELNIINSDNFEITGVGINTKISFIKLIFNFLFSKQAYIAERFISKKFTSTLNKLLNNNQYDFIQIEGLYCLPYISDIRKYFNGKVVYRPHNLEYLIWNRNSQESKSFIRRKYYKILSKRLKNLEIDYLNKYDYIIPISEIDTQKYNKLGNLKPILTIPFGIDIDELTSKLIETKENNNESINYIGALDWIPNQDGLLWFIEKCLPLILNKIPSLKFNIAGRNAPEWMIRKFNHSNIVFHGEVEDAYLFMQNKGPIVVPLFSGSGMRVKIIEGMAMQKTIIATDIAVEGIKCKHNENILISNNYTSFADSIIELINKPTLQDEIGKKASCFVKENYDYARIAENVLNFIK